MVFEFVSLGNIKGYHDEVAPEIEKRKEEAKSYGVNVLNIFYVTASAPVDYDEKENFDPQLIVIFQAPDDEEATRFAKSLYPNVKGQTLLNVSRKSFHVITFESAEEVRLVRKAEPDSKQ